MQSHGKDQGGQPEWLRMIVSARDTDTELYLSPPPHPILSLAGLSVSAHMPLTNAQLACQGWPPKVLRVKNKCVCCITWALPKISQSRPNGSLSLPLLQKPSHRVLHHTVTNPSILSQSQQIFRIQLSGWMLQGL